MKVLHKFIFNEDIKRVFNCISNGQIISQYILKDYISDIQITNDIKKKEKPTENNNKSFIKCNDSSQNLIGLNNIQSKTNTNTSIHPINIMNNSFLYFNSSFKSLILDKLEGLLIECKWKKKYILLLKIAKINDLGFFFKSIEIECIEMNHFENAFNLEISLFWNSTDIQTLMLVKFTTKIKIIEEIINRELNKKDRQKIYDNIYNYLFNDLTNVEHCETSLIFANMKDISEYLSDIKKIIKLSSGIENKRFEVYNSSLKSTMQNCKIYDDNNNIFQEFILTGYYVSKDAVCQIKWEKKLNNKIYCIYRMSIIYLEEKLSLLVFRNIWQKHVKSKIISEKNKKKKLFFEEIKNYFIKKNGLVQIEGLSNNINDLDLKIGVKNYNQEENNQIDLDMFIHTEGILKNHDKKDAENDSQYDSLLLNNLDINNINGLNNNYNSNAINDIDKLFTDTIQNISEIENTNSNFLGPDD